MAVSRRKVIVSWKPQTQGKAELVGSAHMLVLAVLAAIFVSGGCYLYSVNQNAVQGYHMRSLEKEIDALKQENAELRIAEADLRSLHRIEEASLEELQMQKPDTIKYIEERGPVALR